MISVHCCGRKLMRTIFPNLGRHVRCLLAIPATCDRVFSIQLGTLSVANDPVCRQITQICLYLLTITRTFMTDFERYNKKMFPEYSQCFISSVHTHILINYSEIKKNIIESNCKYNNRIESNRKLGESFQA